MSSSDVSNIPLEKGNQVRASFAKCVTWNWRYNFCHKACFDSLSCSSSSFFYGFGTYGIHCRRRIVRDTRWTSGIFVASLVGLCYDIQKVILKWQIGFVVKCIWSNWVGFDFCGLFSVILWGCCAVREFFSHIDIKALMKHSLFLSLGEI